MRISDWSSDVCSSDLRAVRHRPQRDQHLPRLHARQPRRLHRRTGHQDVPCLAQRAGLGARHPPPLPATAPRHPAASLPGNHPPRPDPTVLQPHLPHLAVTTPLAPPVPHHPLPPPLLLPLTLPPRPHF